MDTPSAPTKYKNPRFPVAIISHAVWLYLRSSRKGRTVADSACSLVVLLLLASKLLPSTSLTLQSLEIIGCEKMNNAKNDETRVKKRQNHLKTI